MDKQKFKAMLILLIPQLVKEIVERENISETAATGALYESELYAALEEELFIYLTVIGAGVEIMLPVILLVLLGTLI